jgi:hypothetical protein
MFISNSSAHERALPPSVSNFKGNPQHVYSGKGLKLGRKGDKVEVDADTNLDVHWRDPI